MPTTLTNIDYTNEVVKLRNVVTTEVDYLLANSNISSPTASIGYLVATSFSVPGYVSLTGGLVSFGVGYGLNLGAYTYDSSAFGSYSLSRLTTGLANSAFGAYSQYSITTGSDNSSLGRNSLPNNRIGSNNSAFGSSAGPSSTGDNNLFFGSSSGQTVYTGNDNILIGYYSDVSGSSDSNCIVLGNTTVGHGSNTVTIGTSSTTDNYFTGNLHVTGNVTSSGDLQKVLSINYTSILSDNGYELYHPDTDTTARTFTIDSNLNVQYPIGASITFTNSSVGLLTISINTDTLIMSGSGLSGSRILSQFGSAIATKKTATSWWISGINLT